MWIQLLTAMGIVLMYESVHGIYPTKSPGIALLTAVKKGRKGRLENIFKRPNFDINYAEKEGRYRGYTALIWAAEMNSIDIVQSLLERGANINHKSYFGETAAYIAAKKGSLEILKLLLENGANPNVPAAEGYTALLQATWHRSLQMVNELLAKEANPNYQTPSSRYFALYLATRHNERQIMEALINAGANVNLQTSWGVTALQTATIWGHMKATKILIEAGADPNLLNIYNQTALMKASIYGHGTILQELIYVGAQLDLQDKDGCTAMIWASKRGHSTVITKLLEAGADPQIQDNNGRTSLQWARRNGHLRAVKVLKKHPCSENTVENAVLCQRSSSTTEAPEIIHIHTLHSSSPTPTTTDETQVDEHFETTPSLYKPSPITEAVLHTSKNPERSSSKYGPPPSYVIICSAKPPLTLNINIMVFSCLLHWHTLGACMFQ
ncbi:ankyrin homolog [Macrobrachium nipponense]|uniref:ankyrin homolog n=1 Tax=Macrobrachium nipponense TaxID=159736 RepID=UPI0030C8BF4C